MKEDHIRLCKQLVKRNILSKLCTSLTLISIISKNLHIQRIQKLGSSLSNSTKANDTGSLSIKLDHRIIPVAPVCIIFPFTSLNSLIMMTIVRTDLKKKAKSILTNDLGSVGRHIYNRNVFFFCIVVIHYIIAGSQNSDQLDIRAFVNCLFGDRSFIDDNDLSVSDTLSNQRGFLIGSSVINSNLSKLF